MGTRSRQEYLVVLRERYQQTASKKERSRLVNEAVENTGLHRKSLIRALNSRPAGGAREGDRPPVSPLGRKKKYSQECLEALKKLYRASDYQCSDKLKYMIPTLLEQGHFSLENALLLELMAISPASIDRYLRSFRSTERRSRNSGTRPGSQIFKRLIPIKCLDVISSRCGYLEANTVAHCGGLNHRLYEYFFRLAEEKSIPFPMSRSRSYRKNDNAHLEQKNWTHVRQLFGYESLESMDFIVIMNEVYFIQNMIQNLLMPQFKLK